MRSLRHAGSSFAFLIFASGAFVACSSSSGSPNTDGGTGGSSADASHDATATDAPEDAPATDTAATDTHLTDVAPVDYPMTDGATSPATITLTSSALAEGALFADTNTCAGVNTSPPLNWTAGPTGTLSYAITLNDLNNKAAHWVIWDIPASVTSLPAALPGDTTLTTPVSAMQLHKVAFFGAGGAYRGPCPGANGPHTYSFEVSAIPTATLTLGPNPSTEDIRALTQGVALAHGELTGTSSATAPPADASGQ